MNALPAPSCEPTTVVPRPFPASLSSCERRRYGKPLLKIGLENKSAPALVQGNVARFVEGEEVVAFDLLVEAFELPLPAAFEPLGDEARDSEEARVIPAGRRARTLYTETASRARKSRHAPEPAPESGCREEVGERASKGAGRMAALARAVAACALASVCVNSAIAGEEVRPLAGKTLEIFIGSASKPATEEAAKAFEDKTGCRMLLHFGGSGAMLSQMKLTRRGDLYFPGSSDFMELAKREMLVVPETEKIVVYLIPAINVPAGNPKKIEKLQDLGKPGVRVGIARPDTVCVGLYAVEAMVHNKVADLVKPRIVTHAESCEKTAQLVALGTVDAVLGWRVFEHWNPERIKTIMLTPEQIPRIGYVSIAQSVFCNQPEVAKQFVDFLLSEEGKAIFRKWHYLTTVDEARKYTTKDCPVGGEWPLPKGW